MQKHKMYIGGEWVEAAGGEWFESLNPYTGQPWALVPRGGAGDVDRAVEAAHQAFVSGDWPALTATQRGALLRKLGDLLAENAEHLGRTETQDNGKLIAEMGGQTAYIPQWCYYYGGLADKIEGSVLPIDKPGHLNFTRWEPLGVVAGITPWNSPLLLLMWKLAPALAAGNTMVIKPSEFTSISTLEFMKVFEQAGFPPGVVNVVTGFGADVGAPLVEHPKVAKVAFTGSDVTGARIYEAAARSLKHVTMELGGKSPNIVFDDCFVDDTVKGVISGIFAATGQTCIAGSRLLLQRSIHDQFVDKLVAFAKTARMGDPASLETQVGPVTTIPQYEKVLSYIDVAKGEGAETALGGAKATRPECGEGWFVEPTIFTGVDNQMRIAQEEVFGPVLSVIPFDDEEEAVAIANDINFGLAAGVWTQNMGRAIKISERLRAGTVWVNTYRAVSFMSPFGGYKRSGLGRENGQEMIKEYLQQKSVWIATETEVPNPFVLR
ncbi:MAG TPA: aldehyde dehydrogenase [Alphaproteobacteria bacterium]|jgi:aldehyde dehydrogenase (NAD+)|nr:aldehyde dehydrogenase [Alphaproteobacteria bacterium]HJM52301.1 aldehyde dehydrogenase [Alphaproteobacteria bacterium]